MSEKLLTEHHLEFLSLKGCCIDSSESTLAKMLHCWKSQVSAQNTCEAHTFVSAVLADSEKTMVELSCSENCSVVNLFFNAPLQTRHHEKQVLA